MKKYYLHNGTESSGPFDIEELKAQKITTRTPVWFEGMPKWQTAGAIPELAPVFTTNPPPFQSDSTPEPEIKKELKENSTKILGLSKSAFSLSCIALILLVGVSILNTMEDKRSQELKIKNHQTEIENYQVEKKQKELDEEKIQEVIQDKINSDRVSHEVKENGNKRLTEIQQLLITNQSNLDATKKKLNNASGFKLFRSPEEKKEQMDLFQKNIDSIKNEMSLLERESDELKLELEKIH